MSVPIPIGGIVLAGRVVAQTDPRRIPTLLAAGVALAASFLDVVIAIASGTDKGCRSGMSADAAPGAVQNCQVLIVGCILLVLGDAIFGAATLGSLCRWVVGRVGGGGGCGGGWGWGSALRVGGDDARCCRGGATVLWRGASCGVVLARRATSGGRPRAVPPTEGGAAGSCAAQCYAPSKGRGCATLQQLQVAPLHLPPLPTTH